jgi:hypothetical protein
VAIVVDVFVVVGGHTTTHGGAAAAADAASAVAVGVASWWLVAGVYSDGHIGPQLMVLVFPVVLNGVLVVMMLHALVLVGDRMLILLLVDIGLMLVGLVVLLVPWQLPVLVRGQLLLLLMVSGGLQLVVLLVVVVVVLLLVILVVGVLHVGFCSCWCGLAAGC